MCLSIIEGFGRRQIGIGYLQTCLKRGKDVAFIGSFVYMIFSIEENGIIRFDLRQYSIEVHVGHFELFRVILFQKASHDHCIGIGVH